MSKPNILDFKREAEKMRAPVDRTIRALLASDPVLSSDLIVPVLMDLPECVAFVEFVKSKAPKSVQNLVESKIRGNMVSQFGILIEQVRKEKF